MQARIKLPKVIIRWVIDQDSPLGKVIAGRWWKQGSTENREQQNSAWKMHQGKSCWCALEQQKTLFYLTDYKDKD